MIYGGQCPRCKTVVQTDVKFKPKFITHTVTCPKCHSRFALGNDPLPATGQGVTPKPESFLLQEAGDPWIPLRALACAACKQTVGYANLGDARRLGKVFCSMGCASDALKSPYVKVEEP